MEQIHAAAADNSRKAFGVIDLCYIALFVAIIAVLAQISIPLPGGVPLTLQTLAVPLAGLVLGARRGTIATILYALLGAVGAPVFAGMSGGLQIVIGMTGGFLFSFPLMALAAGLVAEKDIKSVWLWLGLVGGAVVNYAVGTAWFMFVTKSGLGESLAACVAPFIPTAILKIILAGFLGTTIRRALRRAGLLR